MSDFAFFRFASLNLLTEEEIVHKNEIVDITEQVLDAEGIECCLLYTSDAADD